METDGSLKFDTKVDTAGFEKGNDSLLKAAERLTAAIESLSARMDHAFSSSGASAGTMARQVRQKKPGMNWNGSKRKRQKPFRGPLRIIMRRHHPFLMMGNAMIFMGMM